MDVITLLFCRTAIILVCAEVWNKVHPAVYGGLWVLTGLCVILQDKKSRKLSWKGYVLSMIDRFFSAFLRYRYYIAQYSNKIGILARKAVLLLLLSVVLSNLSHLADYAVWIAFLVLLELLMYRFPAALYSCRRLFAVHCTILIISLGTVVLLQGKVSLGSSYVGGLIAMVLLWLLVGGLADYDVAKMASEIVNTITTLGVLIVNILAGVTGIDAEIQLGVNIATLPFVAAGYLTALLKEMQLYWENRYCKDENMYPIQKSLKVVCVHGEKQRSR